MKKLSLFASFISFSSVIFSPSIAAGFSTIYGFGDSLTDTGNIYEATGNAFPVSPPNFEGRFSNGPIWLETLAQQLDTPFVNFSFGGATSGSDNINPLFPGLQQQINDFADNNPVADPNALYTIWIGGNDYLPTNSMTFMPFDNPEQTLSNIETAINSLVEIGAENIMIFNLPNLGDIPLNNQSVDGICPDDNQFDGDCLNDLIMDHNNGLSNLLTSFSSEVNVIPVDVNTLFNNIINSPSSIFANVTDACLDSTIPQVCSNPDEFLWWDNIHPTTVGHQLVADTAFQALGVPEPKTTVGLLTIGLIGIIRKVSNKESEN